MSQGEEEMLEKINAPEDVKKLTLKEKQELADEVRKYIRNRIRKWRTLSIKLRSCRLNNSTTFYIQCTRR